jgi:lipoate-protein ligase A
MSPVPKPCRKATWLLLQSGPCDPAFNMALDEALLEAMPRLGQPVLRFYGWTQPAASFGYFQKFSEVEEAMGRDDFHVVPDFGRGGTRPHLVRRPTGGGIVPHDADWTYSLAFPTSHQWYSLRAQESYCRVHEWIQAAFVRLEVSTELASCCRKAVPGQCFAGHERSDLLWHGKKIAGAAQRRTRMGLLIQGSVQPPPVSLAKIDWQQAVCDVAVRDFAVQWSEFELDASLREAAEALAREKYRQADYARKR